MSVKAKLAKLHKLEYAAKLATKEAREITPAMRHEMLVLCFEIQALQSSQLRKVS